MFAISKLQSFFFDNSSTPNFNIKNSSYCILISKLLFFTLIAFCLKIDRAKAQSKNINSAPKEFIVKVSQFGQFVKRFNYEEDFWGNPVSPSFTKKINRNDYLSLLFNSDDKRLDSTSSYFSQEYSMQKRSFLNSVVKSNYKINRISDSLYSDAICEVLYRNKLVTMHLILKQQKINNGIAWVIVDAFASFIYDKDNYHNNSSFIPPTSNEVNYIHLSSLFEKKDSLASFAYPGYVCNRLSIFFQLINSGDLQYKHVKYIRYFVNDIPGWIICIKEYNRNGMNSGWLIENLFRKETSIIDFLKKESNFS
jgi:hypothetical protein